jgi:hypothetical protein
MEGSVHSNLRYNPGIRLEVMNKTTKNLSQDSRSPGRDINRVSSEYEVEVLTTLSRRFVLWFRSET